MNNNYLSKNLNDFFLNRDYIEYLYIDRKIIDFTLFDYFIKLNFYSNFNFAYHDVIDMGENYDFFHTCFSSQIENSQLSFGECRDLILYHKQRKNSPDEVMVLDCFAAISTMKKLLLAHSKTRGEKILSPSTLITFHSELVTNDTKFINKYKPGEIRQVNVRVGNCICPPPEMVKNYLDNLFFLLSDYPLSIEVAFIVHLYIALIHPFPDGNGRLARLTEYYLLLKCGVHESIAARMAEQYMKNRIDYYYYLSEANTLQGNINFINFSFRLLDELINKEKPDKNKTYIVIEHKK